MRTIEILTRIRDQELTEKTPHLVMILNGLYKKKEITKEEVTYLTHILRDNMELAWVSAEHQDLLYGVETFWAIHKAAQQNRTDDVLRDIKNFITLLIKKYGRH